MDFTITRYKQLLSALAACGYEFITFRDYLVNRGSSPEKFIILRHDVDRKPMNSLIFGEIQTGLGIKGTYYFRILKKSCNPVIMSRLHSMGHEIGYHYEELSRNKGDLDKSIRDFKSNLELFREIVPIDTICMHGSPLSKLDNRSLWNHYDYGNFGLLGEPYLDLNMNQFTYLSDTGRCWNAGSANLRDKMMFSVQGVSLRTTNDLMKAAGEGILGKKVMLTFHPQRWSNHPVAWAEEWISQNLKNFLKTILSKSRN
jgi:hypothetical protein